MICRIFLAERLGFEPREPKGLNGFRDRPVQPLRHLSVIIISARQADRARANIYKNRRHVKAIFPHSDHPPWQAEPALLAVHVRGIPYIPASANYGNLSADQLASEDVPAMGHASCSIWSRRWFASETGEDPLEVTLARAEKLVADKAQSRKEHHHARLRPQYGQYHAIDAVR
jgi:hypothetical protein